MHLMLRRTPIPSFTIRPFSCFWIQQNLSSSSGLCWLVRRSNVVLMTCKLSGCHFSRSSHITLCPSAQPLLGKGCATSIASKNSNQGPLRALTPQLLLPVAAVSG
jgi:hypothetical protein